MPFTALGLPPRPQRQARGPRRKPMVALAAVTMTPFPWVPRPRAQPEAQAPRQMSGTALMPGPLQLRAVAPAQRAAPRPWRWWTRTRSARACLTAWGTCMRSLRPPRRRRRPTPLPTASLLQLRPPLHQHHHHHQQPPHQPAVTPLKWAPSPLRCPLRGQRQRHQPTSASTAFPPRDRPLTPRRRGRTWVRVPLLLQGTPFLAAGQQRHQQRQRWLLQTHLGLQMQRTSLGGPHFPPPPAQRPALGARSPSSSSTGQQRTPLLLMTRKGASPAVGQLPLRLPLQWQAQQQGGRGAARTPFPLTASALAWAVPP
jgi:hypothetical protein